MAHASTLSTPGAQTKYDTAFLTLIQVIGGSFLIALCSQIKIPLSFSPVPITLQTLAVMIVGCLLGKRNGAMSVLLYLTQGSAGLPVWAGGAVNSLALLGPTGGYLIGFVMQAYLAGWCMENGQSIRSGKLLFSLFFISLLQMALGTAWLGAYVGFENAVMMGFLPFLPGDFLKCVAATACAAKFRGTATSL